MEYTATPSTVLSLRLWRRIGNHYFACWCSVKGQPGMLPTGWETGNTYWRRFIRRNGRFILNIESQSECYYYEFYCCTPITVLAVYLSRWRQNATLPSIIVYWRSLHFIPYVTMIGHWARKFNDQMYAYPFKKIYPTDLWLIDTLWIFFRGSYSTKTLCYRKRLDCIYQRDRRISVYW